MTSTGMFDIDVTIAFGADFPKFAQELGHVTWAWSALHADLCDLFIGLAGIQHRKGRSIWYSFRSDSGARDMMKSLLEATGIEDTDLSNEIMWLINETNQISGFRNDAIHVLWKSQLQSYSAVGKEEAINALRRQKISPDVDRGHSRGGRLVDADAMKVFRSLANYCVELQQFSRGCDVRLTMNNPPQSLPNRPQRPPSLLRDSLRKAETAQTSPRPSRTKRRPQP